MTDLSLVGGCLDNGRLPAGERDEPIESADVDRGRDRIRESPGTQLRGDDLAGQALHVVAHRLGDDNVTIGGHCEIPSVH